MDELNVILRTNEGILYMEIRTQISGFLQEIYLVSFKVQAQTLILCYGFNVRHDVHAESVGQFFENDRLAGINERSE